MHKMRNAADGVLIDDNESVDPHEHTEGLKRVFSDVAVRDHGRSRDFYYRHSCVAFNAVRLARISTSGGCFSATNNESFHLGFVVSGAAETLARGRPVTARPFLNANLIRKQDRFAIEVAPHTISQIIEVDPKILMDQAVALMGKEFDVESLPRDVDLACPIGAALVRSSVATLNEIKFLASANLGQLAIASFAELLTNLVLGTVLSNFNTNGSELFGSPQIAFRARDYLVAHSDEPLRIADVANTLGVSIRVLQLSFRKAYGCSPLQFLIQCRLDNAHVRLLAATSNDTVTAIAWQCGFIQPSVFAARYRERFGELPSETLKRSR